MLFLGDERTRLLYESLLSDPKREIAGLSQFVDAPVDEDLLDFFVEKTAFFLLNRPTKLPVRRRFFGKGEAGDRRRYFAESEKAVFKEAAGDMLIELGYEKDFSW